MPTAATKHTADGARAFAKFFIQTIDWGYATTSSTYMRRYYQPSCTQCRVTRLALDNAQRDKQHYLGGRLTIVQVGQLVRGGPQRTDLSVRIVLNISAGELVDRNSRASHPDVAHNGFRELVSMKWLGKGWTIVQIRGEDNG